MSEETLSFQAEVSKLLDIVVHSLYSDRQIFLRELISNASDACDKLRYEGLTDPALLEGDPDFRIRLSVDAAAGTLTIADNGIGMNRQELIDNLGTIARSGTQAFAEALKARKGDEATDLSLIGQFGVGFYSSFMVAQTVEVVTRRAGDAHGWRWTSNGAGSFSVAEAPEAQRGAAITLHLRDDAREFLEEHRLRTIVRTYSDHIAIPVLLALPPDSDKDSDKDSDDDQGDRGEDGTVEPRFETLNEASALWTRPRDSITAEQYTAFYRHVAHGFDEPWHTLHFRAEGVMEYTALLFVPKERPFDLYTPERKPRIKLYVNRVFITDDCESLLPSYLRFVRGIVDSTDLPLNVSREMLQQDPRLRKVRSNLTRRLVDDLAKRAKEDEEAYLGFWAAFGAVLKEGIYEDFERKDDLIKLARFRTTASQTPVSFETIVGRMKEGQSALYYVTGDDADALARSPQVEGFRARGIEVLLLTDPIDEFWVSAAPTVLDKPLRPAAAASADLDAIPVPEEDAKEQPAATDGEKLNRLIAALKVCLGDSVADVRASSRLTDSPVCLVAKEGSLSPHLRKLLSQANQETDLPDDRILEINPRHALIRALAERVGPEDPKLQDAALLLMDQARILEGEAPVDAVAFAQRLTSVLVLAV